MKKSNSKNILKFAAGALIVGTSALGLSTLQKNNVSSENTSPIAYSMSNNAVTNSSNSQPALFGVTNVANKAVPTATIASLKQTTLSEFTFKATVTIKEATSPDTLDVKSVKIVDNKDKSISGLTATFSNGAQAKKTSAAAFDVTMKGAKGTYKGGLKAIIELKDGSKAVAALDGTNDIAVQSLKVESTLFAPTTKKVEKLNLDLKISKAVAAKNNVTISKVILTGKGLDKKGVTLTPNPTLETAQTFPITFGKGKTLSNGTYNDWKISITFKIESGKDLKYENKLSSFYIGYEKSNKTLIIVSSILGVAIIILLALMGWLLYNKRNQITSKK